MANLITKDNMKQNKDWRVLEFNAPIIENFQNGADEFMIKGVAINETTTLNNIKYMAEELSKAAASFRNVPILLDHRNEVKNIVGRTTENVDFNTSFNRIEYEAKIMDKDIQEMIKDGRIQNVSIGAKVNDLLEEEDGSMKAIGIHGLEISMVAVPGDGGANLAQAIQNSFELKEAYNRNLIETDKQLNKKEVKMTKDKIKEGVETPEEVKDETVETPVATEKEVEAVEAPKEEAKEEPAKEVEAPAETTEKTQNININVESNSEMADMKKQLAELKELLNEKKSLKETMEKKDATKGEVLAHTEKIDKLNSCIVEMASKGFALYRDYSKEGSDTKLNRLVR